MFISSLKQSIDGQGALEPIAIGSSASYPPNPSGWQDALDIEGVTAEIYGGGPTSKD